jgi:ADP-ribose pyrophosphatase YjhB (NUDIX family)
MDYPRIAAATVVLDGESRILLVRKVEDGSPDAGLWSLPGGKIDMGETLEAGAFRETLEETGIRILKARRLPIVSEDIDGPGRHFVTFYFQSGRWDGTPGIGEPHKHAEFAWFEKRDLVWAVSGMAADLPLQSSLRRFVSEGGLNHV